MKKRNNRRYIYLATGLFLLPFALLFAVYTTATISDSSNDIVATVITAIVSYSFLIFSVWLLRKWYLLGRESITKNELLVNNVLSIPGVVEFMGKTTNRRAAVMSVDAQSEKITFVGEQETVELQWGQVKRLFIKNAGSGVNHTVYLDTDKGMATFYLVNSPENVAALERASKLGYLGVVTGPPAYVAGIVTALIKKDPKAVYYPDFNPNNLYYWLKNHRAPFLKNRLAPSMLGIVIMSTFPIAWFISSYVVLQIAKALGASESAANGFGLIIGGFLPLIVLVVFYQLVARSYKR